MVGVDPVPAELLLSHGSLPLLLLGFVRRSEVEVLMVLGPGDDREQTGLLALCLTGQVGLEVRVEPGLAGPGEMGRPEVDLWGGLARVEVRQTDRQLHCLALTVQLHTQAQCLGQLF